MPLLPPEPLHVGPAAFSIDTAMRRPSGAPGALQINSCYNLLRAGLCMQAHPAGSSPDTACIAPGSSAPQQQQMPANPGPVCLPSICGWRLIERFAYQFCAGLATSAAFAMTGTSAPPAPRELHAGGWLGGALCTSKGAQLAKGRQRVAGHPPSGPQAALFLCPWQTQLACLCSCFFSRFKP